MIDCLAWPVQPGRGRGNTRPEKLVSELQRLGIVSDSSEYVTHGRGSSSGSRLDSLLPGRGLPDEMSSLAILSPVFIAGAKSTARWIDLYDDWALAPDIHPYYRALAASAYRKMRKESSMVSTITVNSKYMADRLRPLKSAIVPNGVDERLAYIQSSGSDSARLLILGHFFAGRTNFELLTQVALRKEFEDVVICAPGVSEQMMSVLRELRQQLRSRLHIHEWLDDRALAEHVGARTIALVPNCVRDYTLSQDLMKVYQLLSLGVRVMCPRLLWPDSIDREFGLLLDHGMRLDDVLADWIEASPPSQDWRAAFAASHSWTNRARSISSLLEHTGT